MDIKQDVKKKGVYADEGMVDVFIKTIDAGVVNRLPQCDLLQVDEVLMTHAGMIYACAWLTGAKRVIVYGDTKQIGFLKYYTDGLILHQKVKIFKSITKSMCSRRTPAAGIAAVSDLHYDGMLKTCVTHNTDNHIHEISGVS